MWELLIDCLWDGLLDTLKLLPFLYLTYLLMEYLEHRSSNATSDLLKRSGKIGPLCGGVLGAVPQCGFSAAASGLYAGRIISAGTLIAVYLSTSDEMLPILISERLPILLTLKLLGFKLLCGILIGFAVDGIFCFVTRYTKKEIVETPIEDICEREHCRCTDRFALSALKHTLRISLFLFLISFGLNLVIGCVGEETLTGIFTDNPFLSHLSASLVGLIPNCASSVILTKLWVSGVISAGSMLTGLFVNAGIGLLVLFRNNRPVKNSVLILTILWISGIFCGFLADWLPFLRNFFA